jgi:hypothetical protein
MFAFFTYLRTGESSCFASLTSGRGWSFYCLLTIFLFFVVLFPIGVEVAEINKSSMHFSTTFNFKTDISFLDADLN